MRLQSTINPISLSLRFFFVPFNLMKPIFLLTLDAGTEVINPDLQYTLVETGQLVQMSGSVIHISGPQERAKRYQAYAYSLLDLAVLGWIYAARSALPARVAMLATSISLLLCSTTLDKYDLIMYASNDVLFFTVSPVSVPSHLLVHN